MPFTISHAILAPLIAKVSRHHLPVAALAIDCMSPDLIHLFTNQKIIISHEWAGIIIPNLCLGLFFCFLWYVIYRPALYRCLSIEDEIRADSMSSIGSFILLCMLSLILGNITHIIWDGFTHNDSRTLFFHQFLSSDLTVWHYSIPMHTAMQMVSSIVPLPFIALLAYRYYQRNYVGYNFKRLFTRLSSITLFVTTCAAGFAGVIYFIATSTNVDFIHQSYDAIGRSINYFFRGFLSWAALGCIILNIHYKIVKRTLYESEL